MINTKTETPKRTRSLSSVLMLAYFGVSSVAVLIASGLQAALNIRAQQAALFDKQSAIAQDASKAVSDFIEDKFNSLETSIKFTNPVDSTPEAQKTFVDGFLGVHPSFKQFVLLDTQGNILAFSSRSSRVLSAQFTINSQEALAPTLSKKRYISPVYIDDSTNEPLIVMAVPVTNAVGDIQGTLATEVNLKFMWDLVDQLKVGTTGYAYVVDEIGSLIAYKDTTLVLQNKNVKNIDEVNRFIKGSTKSGNASPGFESYFGLNGSRVLGTYVPLGTPNWAVVVELPLSEAYQSIYTLVFQTLAIILGIALIAGVIGSFGARFSVRSLAELSKVTSEVEKGNFNVQMTPRGPTEIVNLAVAFNGMTRQLGDLVANLERRVNERTREIERRSNLLKAVADAGKAITSYRDLSELLNQTTYLIHENFGYYHVGIFLLDEHKEYAVLSASNSQGGRRMLERKHQLKVGETGIVGYVTQHARPRIALDVGTDAVYFDNPDLPQTRSEMALPLVVGAQVLGALDVQSTEAQAFSDEDISTLQTLADQIAIAIQNANLFSEIEKALETSRLNYGQLSREAWGRILRSQPRIGFLATAPATVQTQPDNLDSSLSKAFETGNTIIGSDGLTLSLPVRVRGQVIGAIRLKKSAISESWTQEETNLAVALSDQLSGALESARLYKESQQLAARESLISDISARINASAQTDAILRETVLELGQAIGNASVTFQLLNQTNGHSQVETDSYDANASTNDQDGEGDPLDNTEKVRE